MSEIARGHQAASSPPGGDPADPGHVDVHMWEQPHPGLGAGVQHTLTMTPGEQSRQHASSLSPCHPKTVTVTSYSPQAAAGASHPAAFHPSGVPAQPAPAIAPTSVLPVAPRPAAVPYAPPPGSAA